MAYDRYESRRGGREPRSRSSQEFGDRNETRGQGRSWDRDDDDRDRGFFDRAGDEVASWFGDEEAERRRREDMRQRGDDSSWRGEDNSWRRQGAFMSDDDFGRQPRFRDEGYRRPYTGRPVEHGSRDFGPDRSERPYRPMAGDYGRGTDERAEGGGSFYGVGAHHDRHYGEWRARQVDELDRDYEDYARENRSRFEDDFTGWREKRQGKRQLLRGVREQMEVVGSDGEPVGTVERAAGDRLILAKSEGEGGGAQHSLMCTAIDRVEDNRVVLDMSADDARKQWRDDNRDRALFERDDQGQAGPGILNRSFSGTY